MPSGDVRWVRVPRPKGATTTQCDYMRQDGYACRRQAGHVGDHDIDAHGARAILVVPAADWRERLLGDGPCGARVPWVWRGESGRWVEYADDRAPQDWWDAEHWARVALALAWDGRPTGPEGLARALACLAEREGAKPSGRGLWWRCWAPTAGRVDECGVEGIDVSGGEPLWYAPADITVHHPVPALASPPDGLGDLLDLWALAVVLQARVIAERVEVVR